ncbi:MAG TPA: MBL fold metallo-hydrolase, partial [Burkholderiaceae bacterium]|nr:MBL fold metallo-hydrolase [Burkholderiaceae bacterium]
MIGQAEPSQAMRVLERGWVSSNNILLADDDHSATLIDTGYVAHGEQTLQLVRHALAGRKLTRIINTHLHSDHCGGNARLKRELGADVVIPPGLAAAVERWDQATLGYSACGQACDRFMYDALLQPGEKFQTGGSEWQAFASPGHDPHSIVLWNAQERTLISADALWEHGFGAIFSEVEGESGFAEQRAILQLIANLEPRLVIPGHGAPFTEVDQALARAFGRLAVLEASPERNARNVIRTLLKFHLLIVRQVSLPELIEHFRGAHYAEIVNQRYFRLPFSEFIQRTVDELAAGGALE